MRSFQWNSGTKESTGQQLLHTAQKLVNSQEGSSIGYGSRNFMDKVILKMDFEERGTTLTLREGEVSFTQEEGDPKGDSSLLLLSTEGQIPNNAANGEELHSPSLLTPALCDTGLPHSIGFLNENPSAKKSRPNL